jgi:hypothetical protein
MLSSRVQRDESVAERHDAVEQFMRAQSNADAEHAEDAGEFPGTPTQAASSAEGCAQPRQRNAKRKLR